jgi:hypothetical protein
MKPRPRLASGSTVNDSSVRERLFQKFFPAEENKAEDPLPLGAKSINKFGTPGPCHKDPGYQNRRFSVQSSSVPDFNSHYFHPLSFRTAFSLQIFCVELHPFVPSSLMSTRRSCSKSSRDLLGRAAIHNPSHSESTLHRVTRASLLPDQTDGP